MAALAVLATAPATAASAAPRHAAVSHAASGLGVAPYVDMSNSQESLLDTGITQHGLKAFTAAFVIGVGCNQEWGDTEPVGNDPFIDPEISRAKSEGAQVIVSSGGADGEPLAWTCTNQSTIDADYQQIMSDYSPAGLDFDIEGAAEADTASATRNFQAMKDDGISNYSVTLPVLPSGLTNYGIGIVQAAQNLGMKIPMVNIMAMDYYQGTGVEMGQAAIQAAQSTLSQLQAINPSYTMANVGITPMIGTNDDGSTFTLSDASTLVNWANSNGAGRLAFWAVTRDQACGGAATTRVPERASSTCSGVSQSPLAFTSAFTGFNGGGGGGNSFSVALSPASATVAPGASTTATVNTQVTSGSAQSVTLSATGKPSGVTTSFTPKTVTAGAKSTMTVKVASTVAAGTYNITVKGKAASGTQTASYALTVGSGGGGGGGAIVNGGFESGSLSPWTCQPGDAVVTSPVHSGSHAAQITATGSQTGECDQSVSLSANTSYTLTGWVDGNYAYIGVSGGASASTWTSSSGWTQLSVPFTTGSSGSVTVFVHGWYSQGNVYADDFSLTAG